MKVNFHNPKTAEPTLHQASAGGMFCALNFRGDDDEVTLFLRAHQMDAARAIGAIFNGDVEYLAERIGNVLNKPSPHYALAIACDLTGKPLDEALRERREAEDAA